jgi:hypothetical protein
MGMQMRYAVKFEFDTSTSMGTGSKILVYPQKTPACAMYNTLSLAYARARPVTVNGGRKIDVLGTWLYEVDAEDHDKIIAEVKSGNATLIDFAPEIAVDLDKAD